MTRVTREQMDELFDSLTDVPEHGVVIILLVAFACAATLVVYGATMMEVR